MSAAHFFTGDQVMKYLAVLLFLPGLALAQPQQAQQPLSFEEYKKAMQPAIEESLPVMRATRACLDEAATKEASEQCMITNAEKVIALQKKLGSPAAAEPQDPQEMGKFPEGFAWNEDVKKKMLQNMDRAIEFNTIKQECLTSSNTKEEMGECMRSKMPAPSKP
jgi:hypothetical protein